MSKRTCSVVVCKHPHKARGWCHKHYAYRWRNGLIQDIKTLSPWDRFWANVNVDGVCWEWDQTKLNETTGYGVFGADGRSTSAHRYAWEILVGEIPSGKQLDHLCRNRGCVNPDHMEPVTIEENVLRGYGITAQNARKTHCVRGHEFNESNTRYRTGANGKTWRKCRACAREDRAAWRAKKRA